MTKNIDNTTVKFYGKVSDTTKETSIKTVEKLKQNMNNDQFFDELTVNIGKRYRKIDYDNKFSKSGLFFDYNTKGYCNIFDDKQCYISEKAHKLALNSSNFIDKTSTVADKEDIMQKELSHTITHEIGHLFDDYAVYNSPEDREIFTNLLLKEKKPKGVTDEELLYIETYLLNNNVSDSSEFQDALYSDISNANMNDLTDESISLFVHEFVDYFTNQYPSKKDIKYADSSRSEVFAQLFAYANGTDDGLKEIFLKIFPNTYNFVEEFIKNPSTLTVDNKVDFES